MAHESLPAGVRPEGRLAPISRRATAPLVIPLLTGLSFAASTVFVYVSWSPGFSHHPEALPIPIVCLSWALGWEFPCAGL